MVKQDYIPHNKAELEAWAKSFVTTEAKNVDSYGIREAGLKVTQANVDAYSSDLETERELIEQKRKQVAITAQHRAVLVNDLRATAQMIKASPDYTPDVGKEFDIIGPENPFNPDTYKPELKLRKVSGGVEVSFTKSQTDGVNIYRRKSGDEKFVFLSRDTHSPYIDTHDIIPPVKLEYYAMAVINDDEIGLESDTAKITI
ncbi:MAG: hypothetical protein J7L46_02955 [Bacteroidales bacterium]|nr:hypothetical protein [Bacteroidales bacterium]